MNKPTCPHCNKPLVISVAITKEEGNNHVEYITRAEMAEDEAKPFEEQQYDRAFNYKADIDRFEVVRINRELPK